MNISDYQQWVSDFYQKRGWNRYNSFIRCNFLTEEVGELAQAIRKREIGRDRPDESMSSDDENIQAIKEELGDVLDNLFVLADLYQISLEEIMVAHRTKLEQRYKE